MCLRSCSISFPRFRITTLRRDVERSVTVEVASKVYWKTVANSTRKDPNITKSDVLSFKLPLPPIATQQAIVAEIEAEQALVPKQA